MEYDYPFGNFGTSFLHKYDIAPKLLDIYTRFRFGDHKSAKNLLEEVVKSDGTRANMDFYTILDALFSGYTIREEIRTPELEPLSNEVELRKAFEDRDFETVLQLEDYIKDGLEGENHVFGYLVKILADSYRLKWDNVKGMELYSQGIEFAERLDDQVLLIDLLISQSEIVRREEGIQKANKQLDSILEKTKEINYIGGIQYTLHAIGINHFRGAEYNQATLFIEKSLSIREEYGFQQLVGQSLMLLGMIGINTAKYDYAEIQLKKSLKIYLDLGQEMDILDIKGLISHLYTESGKLNKAMELSHEILETYEKRGDKVAQAETLMTLSQISRRSGDYNQALMNLERANKLTLIQNRQLKGRILTYLGDLHRLKADFTEAKNMYEEARQLFEKIQNSQEIALVLLNLGKLH